MLVDMRSQVAVVVAALSLVAACGKESSRDPGAKAGRGRTPAAARSELGDLSSSLAAVRQAFNARKGQARFLTLLSPT